MLADSVGRHGGGVVEQTINELWKVLEELKRGRREYSDRRIANPDYSQIHDAR